MQSKDANRTRDLEEAEAVFITEKVLHPYGNASLFANGLFSPTWTHSKHNYLVINVSFKLSGRGVFA